MSKNIETKSVVIIGATGGLGSGFARALAEKGAKLLLVGRNAEKLNAVKNSLRGDINIAISDLTDLSTLEELSNRIKEWSPEVDLIINASGYDVRKSLEDHSIDEIKKLIDINLMGTILITKTLMKNLKDINGSTMIHIGGFGDGRMAFPYYSVDVATRAGVFTFIESVNREMETEGKKIRITYFCPSPAETEAERPYHNLWRKMGIRIVSVEKVAEELIKIYEKKMTVGIMGGKTTVIFAKLNSVMPKLADLIIMKRYGKMLREYLYSKNEANNGVDIKSRTSGNFLSKIAVVLLILSFVFYGSAFLLIPLSLPYKAMIIPGLIILGEFVWWLGVAIVGKQAVTKYRKFLNPCNWCRGNSSKSF
ncbi:MAG: SDR family NAD(P)-dependent oxidoreductase [Solirubrobacterales bacterium]